MSNDGETVDQLERYRDDLRRIVRYRLDTRLYGRLDESDIVQEVLATASKHVDQWASDPSKSVFACLYQLTRNQIARVHRDHVSRAIRAVHREEADLGISDRSAVGLAERLSGREVTPSQKVLRNEIQREVRKALAKLRETDREVLIMRILEGVPAREVGQVLGISEDAVNMRQLRALQRIRPLLIKFKD